MGGVSSKTRSGLQPRAAQGAEAVRASMAGTKKSLRPGMTGVALTDSGVLVEGHTSIKGSARPRYHFAIEHELSRAPSVPATRPGGSSQSGRCWELSPAWWLLERGHNVFGAVFAAAKVGSGEARLACETCASVLFQLGAMDAALTTNPHGWSLLGGSIGATTTTGAGNAASDIQRR